MPKAMPRDIPTGSGINTARLKQLRAEADLTLAGLGELAGVTESSMWRLESGRRTGRSETIRRIADALAANLRRPVGDILTELTDPQ